MAELGRVAESARYCLELYIVLFMYLTMSTYLFSTKAILRRVAFPRNG